MNDNKENEKFEKDLADSFEAAENCCAANDTETINIQDVYNDLLNRYDELEKEYVSVVDKLDALEEAKDLRGEYLRKAYELLNDIDTRKRVLGSEEKNFIRDLGKLCAEKKY